MRAGRRPIDAVRALLAALPTDLAGLRASAQARQQTGYAVAQFAIDWDAQHATCPRGKTSVVWKELHDSAGHPVVNTTCTPRRNR